MAKATKKNKKQIVNIYTDYKGERSKGRFNPSKQTVCYKGEWMKPTAACKAATNQPFVNGHARWRLANDCRIGGKSFDAGTPIGDVRGALNIAVAERLTVKPSKAVKPVKASKGRKRPVKATKGHKALAAKGVSTRKAGKGTSTKKARRTRTRK